MNMTNAFIPRTLIITKSFFCLYIDDILILGTYFDAIQRLNDYLSINLDMKDLGHADMILGMKISRTPNRISLSLSQALKKYIINLISITLNLFLHSMILQLL